VSVERFPFFKGRKKKFLFRLRRRPSWKKTAQEVESLSHDPPGPRFVSLSQSGSFSILTFLFRAFGSNGWPPQTGQGIRRTNPHLKSERKGLRFCLPEKPTATSWRSSGFSRLAVVAYPST